MAHSHRLHRVATDSAQEYIGLGARFEFVSFRSYRIARWVRHFVLGLAVHGHPLS